MSEEQSTKLEAVGNFISKLTPKSLFLGVIAGFLGLALITLYESRILAFSFILSSPLLMVGIVAGFVLILCGWLVGLALTRLEEYQQKILEDKVIIIGELKTDLQECREDCKDETKLMFETILEKINEK